MCGISSSMLISSPWLPCNRWCSTQIVRQKLTPLRHKSFHWSLFIHILSMMLHFLNKLGPAWGWRWSRTSWSWRRWRWRRWGAGWAEPPLHLSSPAFILSRLIVTPACRFFLQAGRASLYHIVAVNSHPRLSLFSQAGGAPGRMSRAILRCEKPGVGLSTWATQRKIFIVATPVQALFLGEMLAYFVSSVHHVCQCCFAILHCNQLDHPTDYSASILLIVISWLPKSTSTTNTSEKYEKTQQEHLADRDNPLMGSPESSRNSVPPQGTGSRKPLEAVRQYRTLSINDKGYSLTSDVF